MAKRCWSGLIALQLAGLAGALYSLFQHTKAGGVVIGLAAILLPLVTFYLKEKAGAYYSLGERMRRLILIKDALGRQPSASELVDISSDSTTLPSLSPKPLGDYYDSPLPKGHQRLAHIVEESAPYTRKVAAVAASVFGALTVVGLISTFLVIWLGLETTRLSLVESPQEGIEKTAQLGKLITVLLPFFVTGTFASLWRSFSSLSESARKTFEKCDALRQRGDVELLDVLIAVGSYNCALAKAPPLPTFIYWLLRNRIGRAWAEHMSK